jgi:hypothetical protein
MPGLEVAELYDPTTGIFSMTGSLITLRNGHSATLPVAGTFSLTGNMSIFREDGGVGQLVEK